MKKEITLAFVAFSCAFSSITAQNSSGKISGKILDPEGKAVAFANTILYASADSSIAKVEYSGDDGSFEIQNVPEGNYWLSVSYVGVATYNSEPFGLRESEELSLPPIHLKPADNELGEVVVTAKKPLVEVHPDKTIFNVEGSINATGNNALELLRKAPGVIVDNNDNVMLNGKNGVKIYIDGKPSPLSTADLAAFLKTIQSTEIEAIEIITNPSAKYEAEGNAGIINIRMKKDKRQGANANLNLGYSIGKFAHYNGSLSGNYRDKKLNLFGSYAYNDATNYNFFNLYREQFGKVFDQENVMSGDNASHNFKVGADFFLNKKSTFGFLANGYVSDFLWKTNSRTPISSLGQTQIDSVLLANSTNDGSRSNYNLNLNYRYDDGEGTIWNVDGDYGFFKNRAQEFQPNFYKDPTETITLRERITNNETPTDIDIYALKVDHERPLLKGQLSVGLKIGYVKTDNTFNFYNLFNEEQLLDPDRSNRFIYKEHVNAGYLNFKRQFDKIGFQAGLRVEQTNSTGDLLAFKPTNNEKVKRNYLDFFPSGGITFQANDKNNFQLTYSRRIDRPSYQDLNPFENKLDELTFQKGNPFLNPQYTNNFQLTHTLNSRYNTTIGYSHTTDLITRITDVSGQDASFITWLNLAQQNNFSLTFSAPATITKWWNAFFNLSAYRTVNKADYGDGKTVDLKVNAFNIYGQQTFSLPANMTFEVSGWYASPSIWGATFKMDAMWDLDAGLQKKILSGRGSLKVSVSDIFKTNNWSGTSQFGRLFMAVDGGWDSRRFKVNLTYLFGNEKVKKARRRETGLEEEAKRIKTDN